VEQADSDIALRGAPYANKQLDIATHTLGLLLTITGSAAGAVFAVGPRVRLLHALGVDHRSIERVEMAVALGLGDALLVRDDHAILPLDTGPAKLAFYLDRPASVSSAKVSRLLSHVASCLSDDEEGEMNDDDDDETAFAPPLGETRTSFVERRRALLDLCTREEWNLSKVARVLRRSRVFVYRMLREHNIERPGGKRHCFGR
jgi:hypothetical protein